MPSGAEEPAPRPRPTPVRVLMQQDQEAEDRDRAAGESTASRLLAFGGETWSARAVGAGRTGSGEDRGAPLLLVRFSGPGGDRKEGWAVAASLEDLGDDGLLELLARARPAPESG